METVELRTLASFRNGVNFSKSSFGRGMKILGVADFADRVTPDYDDLEEIDPSGVVRDENLLQPDDIVFVRSNGNRSLIGRSLYIGTLPGKVTHSGFTIRTRFHSDQACPRFFAYLFRSEAFRAHLSAHGGGTNISNLNQGVLGDLVVPLPPMDNQLKIAAILSAYDDLIENNTRRIAILEEMARLLYREWFVNFRFPGHESVQMVESGLGPIPEGWDVELVEDCFDVIGGGTPSKSVAEYWEDPEINWFTPSDLTATGAMFFDASNTQISKIGLQRSSARLFPPFSVMMTSRATLGVLGINTTEASTNQGFITCIPNERFPLYLLYHWLAFNVDDFIAVASGATFKEITKGTFKKMRMLVPPAQSAEQFQETLEPMGGLILGLLRANVNLRLTRDLLLPRLISGELDVEDLDIEIGEEAA